jgi:hypothetical protein
MYGRGHERGTRKQKPSTSAWWYQTEEAQEILRQLDAEEAAKAAQGQQPHPPSKE